MVHGDSNVCQVAVEGHLHRDEAETVLAAVPDAVQEFRLPRATAFSAPTAPIRKVSGMFLAPKPTRTCRT